MTDPGPVPASERRRVLEDLVLAEVREVLLLPDRSEVPRQVAFFDLGMTSLRITELRQRLTRLLGRRVDTEELFEHATLDRLLDHLAGTGPAAPVEAPAPPPMLDGLLKQLYR